MGGGGGPPAITFTINTLLANLTEEDRQSIEDSITEILQGLGSGNVTFSEFREGSAIVDASPQNFVSAEAVNEVVKESGNIKTLGTQRFIVAKINEDPVEYTDKLIIVPTDDNADIIYINNEPANTVERGDWEAEGIAPEAIKSVAFGNSVTTIGVSAFRFCTRLTQVTIPDSVTTISDGAFEGCTSLTEVTIPDSVQTIGVSAFVSCTSLTEVTIGNSVLTIGVSAFRFCTRLTQVTFGNSVTSIGEFAFRQCTRLTQVTIPDSVTTIGTFAFSQCTSLTQVTIPDSVTTIGLNAFSRCASLTQVTIGNSVTTIGVSAFRLCTSLTQVTIPDSVTTISEGAFEGCTSLARVILNSVLVTTIEDGVFSNCPAVIEATTDFVVPNDRNEEISFEANNQDFSNLRTGDGTLEFGTDDSGGLGFKTVTVV